MTNFLVHDPSRADCEEGEVHVATKVYGPEAHPDHPKSYHKTLAEQGFIFAAHSGPKPLSLHSHYLHKRGGIKQRPKMPLVVVSKNQVRAGKNDGIKVSNLPRPCRVTVMTGGFTIFDQQIATGSLEIDNFPVPARYVITFQCWPYQMWHKVVEAVA